MEEQRILLGLDLSLASGSVIEILIEDASDSEIFDDIARANTGRPEILRLLLDHPDTPDSVLSFVQGILHLPVKQSRDAEPGRRASEPRARNLLQKIQALSVTERRQLALKGGREIRSILSKDTNKEVVLNVLENHKITETEVEMFARSRSAPEEGLRTIAKNREWVKNYAIALALVGNPKTPPGIAVTLAGELKIKDLTLLEKNRNVSEAVRSAAKRIIHLKKPR